LLNAIGIQNGVLQEARQLLSNCGTASTLDINGLEVPLSVLFEVSSIRKTNNRSSKSWCAPTSHSIRELTLAKQLSAAPACFGDAGVLGDLEV